MEFPQKPKSTRNLALFVVAIVIASIVMGALFGYLTGYSTAAKEIDNLQNQVTSFQEQLANFHSTQVTEKEKRCNIRSFQAGFDILSPHRSHYIGIWILSIHFC